MSKKQLTMEQKSVYLIILNATMILRSIGKTFRKNKKKLKDFKIKIFDTIDGLIYKMEHNNLKERDIISCIEKISDKFNISFGQTQKAINVILKYHYYLYEKYLANNIKQILHCPIDSTILNELGMDTSLTRINKKEYLEIQRKILEIQSPKINFDRAWDKQLQKNMGFYG